MVKEGERRNLFLKLILWKIYKLEKKKKLEMLIYMYKILENS